MIHPSAKAEAMPELPEVPEVPEVPEAEELAEDGLTWSLRWGDPLVMTRF